MLAHTAVALLWVYLLTASRAFPNHQNIPEL